MMAITRLTGGLTPADGSDPRTFPAIWNATADDIEQAEADILGKVAKAGDTMTGLLTAPNFYIEVGTAASDTIDFDFAQTTAFISRAATGNIVFTGSNYVAGGIKSARIVNGGTLRTLSFPAGWTFVGVKPSDIAANKTGILTVTSFSTTEGECVAGWAVEA